MKRRCCIFLIFWLLLLAARAQQGFFVPKNASVYFAGDTATIFSNVTNNGRLGVGKNAVVNFSGGLWQNAADALLFDESDSTTGTGGWIRFTGITVQQLLAGYHAATQTGPSFANLQLANAQGLQLLQSSAKVRRQFAFVNGRVYLNNQIFVVGHHTPGSITGYSPDRFFVTGSQPGSGMLLRENIHPQDGLVVFPVGTRAGSYTPAAIQSKTGQGDDYFVNVFDGVKTNLFSGTDLAPAGVNKTWQAGKWRFPGNGEAALFLQHQLNDEGTYFSPNRNKAYISQYFDAGWDTGKPQAAPSAGILTTSGDTRAGGLNGRTFGASFTANSYFTKFTAHDSLRTHIIWGAYRLSRNTVMVHWQTKPEINVRSFVVQRRLSHEAAFYNVHAALSRAANGISFDYLNYAANDANSYSGISYYRLQVFDYAGQSYFTDVVAVNSEMGNRIALWPNPTPDRFSVLVNSPVAKTLAIYNDLGQKMYVQPVVMNNQNVLEVQGHRLIPGVYVVCILDKDGKVLDRAKLLIQY